MTPTQSTNNSGSSACVEVDLTAATCNAQLSEYLGSFDPTNLATNYMGDPGLSTGAGGTVTNSVTLAAGQSMVIVVNDPNGTTGCGPYTVTVNGLGGACAPTDTPVATATCQAGTTSGSFTVVSPLPFAARGIAVASDGTYTYMNGGYDGSSVHNDTLRYDPVTDTYTTLAPSPDQHFLGQGVYDSGKFYVLGGFDAGSSPTNLTRIYDIASNTWSTGANMPVALTDHAVAIYNGVIYVAGGYDGFSETSGLYAYNIAGNSWTTLASMPQALYLPGIGAINGKLYVDGGATSSQADLNTNYIYDIASGLWSSGAVLPTGVTSPASVVVSGQLWIMGGGFNVLGTGAAGSENKGQKPASPDTTTMT